MKKWRNIWAALAVVWMAVIFAFSAKTAGESSKDSLLVGKMIGEIFVSDFESWTKERQDTFAEAIEYPVRKAAHATEYAILGFLLFQTIRSGTKTTLGKIRGFAWGIGTCYAAADEFHQLFVPGRGALITDVLIDSGGVLAGVAVAALTWRLWNRKKKEKTWK